jgi:dipeptidyl peptidase IV (DPP IV)-like protein
VPCFHRRLWYSLVISVVASLPLLADRSVAQTPPETPTRLTVAWIVSSEFQEEVSGSRHWLKDDSAYLGIEWSEGGKGQEIVRHDPVSGKREVLVPAHELVPRGAKGPLHIDDFAISGDGRKLLLFTNTRKVWRLNTRGDYWVLDRGWSPDGQAIAYWQVDSSEVPEYPMLNTAVGLYPSVIPVRYPKSGQRNPATRVGVVPASGGATRWLEIPGDPRHPAPRGHAWRKCVYR